MTQHDDFEKTKNALMRLAAVPGPDPLRRASARHAFLGQAARLRAGPAAGRLPRSRAVGRLFRLAAAVTAALGLALASMTGVAYAADGALPGDVLYPLDQEIEQLQLALSPSAEHRTDLLLAMAGERLQEAEDLAAQGDEEHMAVALESYEQIVSAVSDAVDSSESEDKSALTRQLNEQLTDHEERLQAIRQHVPEPAQSGLDRAIEAARQGHRNDPNPEPAGDATPTDDETGHGRPDKTPGPPGDRPHGPPEDRGRPDKTKEPKK